jgi:hypothetical protein
VGLGPVCLATNDFNKDGNADLAVCHYDSGDVSVLLNNHTPKAYKQSIEVMEDTPTPIMLSGTAGPLTYTIVAGPTNGTLSGTAPDLVYRPMPNANGKDYIDFKVDDGTLTSAVVRIAIKVVAVNDQPSFTLATGVVGVNEDCGTVKYPGFITSFSKGPANEARQTTKYELSRVETTGHGEALFAKAPAISTAGTLSFMPAKHAYGQAVITVRLKDNGGTANGGVDTSEPQVFTLYVTNVNDAPTLTSVMGKTIFEDRWTNFVFTVNDLESGPGPLALTVASTNQTLLPNDLIMVLASNTTRTVVVEPEADAFGKTLLTFTLSDGTNAVSRTATLTVNAVNDAPSFTLRTNLVVVRNNAGQVTNNVVATASKGPANEVSQTLTYTIGNNTNTALFLVQPSIKANGNLVFKPKTGANGSVTLSVTLKDSGGALNGGANTCGPLPLTITITP